MFQNKPTPSDELEKWLRAQVGSEGKEIADMYMLIHTKSGLLSESPVCTDPNFVLKMAREIVSSFPDKGSEASVNEPFDEQLYQSLVQNESLRVAQISQQIYDICALSWNVDSELLVAHARWILSPYMGIESEAQANNEIAFPGVNLKED